jgi:hypothetical protein
MWPDDEHAEQQAEALRLLDRRMQHQNYLICMSDRIQHRTANSAQIGG